MELVGLAPDVILAAASAAIGALQQSTRTIPIVFTTVADPVGAGFVETLAHPGGNITGFSLFEYTLSGKWLELLKEIAPGVTRAAVLRDPAVGSGAGQYAIIQAVAPSLQVELRPFDVRDPGEIERAIVTFAQTPNGGLIIAGSPAAVVHRNLIIRLAAHHQLPAVYSLPYFARSGGLIAYGPDTVSPCRRRRNMSIAFSRARSQRTFQCKRLRSTNWSSTSRPRKLLDSMCRRRFSPAPTR